MIQFNLLPDVKIEYLHAQYMRRLMTLVSLAVTALSITVLAVFFVTHVLKNRQLTSLSNDIKKSSQVLKGQDQLNRKLTVQNQLSGLTQLHDTKLATPQVFDYLNQVTPDKVVSITNFKIDFTASTVTITGTADSLASVNKYVDTLKFTKYRTDTATAQSAFHGVVLSTFSYTTPDLAAGAKPSSDQPAHYVIDFSYDPIIFNITQNIKLDVPSIITTRSAVDQPAALFRADATPTVNGGTR